MKTFNFSRGGNFKHLHFGTPIYASWQQMIQRCTNSNNPAFKNYGARGITVCDRWKHFPNFLADMSPRPEGMTIERKDNNLGYSPDNCKWATRSEQNRNRRNSLKVTIDGVTKHIRQWCEEYGISFNTVKSRIDRQGRDPVEAIQTKVAV